MKIGELMVNNWYQWYSEGKYYPFKILARDFVNDNYRNFEPIKLTVEMLVKNGFMKSKGNETQWFYPNNISRFVIDVREDVGICAYGFGDDIYFKYVHQLQNALRFCRLYELADNFKIE